VAVYRRALWNSKVSALLLWVSLRVILRVALVAAATLMIHNLLRRNLYSCNLRTSSSCNNHHTGRALFIMTCKINRPTRSSWVCQRKSAICRRLTTQFWSKLRQCWLLPTLTRCWKTFRSSTSNRLRGLDKNRSKRGLGGRGITITRIIMLLSVSSVRLTYLSIRSSSILTRWCAGRINSNFCEIK